MTILYILTTIAALAVLFVGFLVACALVNEFSDDCPAWIEKILDHFNHYEEEEDD